MGRPGLLAARRPGLRWAGPPRSHRLRQHRLGRLGCRSAGVLRPGRIRWRCFVFYRSRYLGGSASDGRLPFFCMLVGGRDACRPGIHALAGRLYDLGQYILLALGARPAVVLGTTHVFLVLAPLQEVVDELALVRQVGLQLLTPRVYLGGEGILLQPREDRPRRLDVVPGPGALELVSPQPPLLLRARPEDVLLEPPEEPVQIEKRVFSGRHAGGGKGGVCYSSHPRYDSGACVELGNLFFSVSEALMSMCRQGHVA